MKWVSITAKSLAAISVLCASGCVYLDYQAYDGPKRPREEVAILHMVQDSVKTVDGVEHAGTFSIYGTRVFLLPGQHSVVFKYEGKQTVEIRKSPSDFDVKRGFGAHPKIT